MKHWNLKVFKIILDQSLIQEIIWINNQIHYKPKSDS